MTTADKVARIFEDDGRNFYSPLGTLDMVCCLFDGVRRWRYGYNTDEYCWDFDDGSCISVCPSVWDKGFAGCYCFAGVGHSADCDAREAEGETP